MGVKGEDQRLLDNARFLCVNILEPIRVKFGPVHIHDAYRDPRHNNRVGGKPESFHLFRDGKAAADFDCLPTSFETSFDWIRLLSGLPFDKVIVESDTNGVIRTLHIQVDHGATPRRRAYTGNTGAGATYVQVLVK